MTFPSLFVDTEASGVSVQLSLIGRSGRSPRPDKIDPERMPFATSWARRRWIHRSGLLDRPLRRGARTPRSPALVKGRTATD